MKSSRKSVALFFEEVFCACRGVRYSESRYLWWEDIDLERGLVSCHNTKNGRSRTVPLLPEFIEDFVKPPREWLLF